MSASDKTPTRSGSFGSREYFESQDRRRLALFLRTIRKSCGMSKADLAKKAGYESQAIITAIESAGKSPDSDRIIDLANALDVSIEQLKGYGRIELTDNGWPKLTEKERIALFLIAPILKELSDEETRHFVDTGLLLCKAKGRMPAWKKPKYAKENSGDIPEK